MACYHIRERVATTELSLVYVRLCKVLFAFYAVMYGLPVHGSNEEACGVNLLEVWLKRSMNAKCRG